MRVRGGASKSTRAAWLRSGVYEVRRGFELLGAAVLGGAVVLAGARWFAEPAADLPQAQLSAPNEAPVAQGGADAGSVVGPSVEELSEALEREAQEREILAAEVELMRSVLEQLTALPPGNGGSTEAGADEAASARGGRMQFDEERLAALGMLESEIGDLRRQWDSAQLAILEIRDRAMRNGTLSRPGHQRETLRVRADLRNEVGDDAYDRILYATGQLNRPVIRQVLGGSSAAYAGLRAGDHVISYAGSRVFKPAGLTFAIAKGTRGEQVRLEVDRNGERISVVVPRGPLGILMTGAASAPR